MNPLNSSEEIPEAFAQEYLFTAEGFTVQLCCSQESLKQAFALRYKAYRHHHALAPSAAREFSDPYDLQANTRTHLVWHQGQPVASVRSAIWAADYQWAPTEAVDTFWHELHKEIGLQHSLLESCRFVIDPALHGRVALQAQLLLFRIQDLSTQYSQCPYVVTVVRPKHVAFYQRMLGFQQASPPRRIEWLGTDAVLLKGSAATCRQTIAAKGMMPGTAHEVARYAQVCETLNQPCYV